MRLAGGHSLRTEHAVWMRAMEPLRSWMRSGLGSLSRIRVWSVEGPRGAKLGEVGEVEVVGEDGRDWPLPLPMCPSASDSWSASYTSLYLQETRPAASRLVSRSPCRRYRIVCVRVRRSLRWGLPPACSRVLLRCVVGFGGCLRVSPRA
jgi:hypothetical protein